MARGLIPAGAGNTVSPLMDHCPGAAHPRRRGEHDPCGSRPWRDGGSSPQARGTPPQSLEGRPDSRLIPAGAGNTPRSLQVLSLRRAHPRRRGEHIPAQIADLTARGSSPQARGTQRVLAVEIVKPRLIPAGAGNTAGTSMRALRLQAHPRRRGEHSPVLKLVLMSTGSSPQARGTPR